MILLNLFLVFAKVGVMTFGGGYAMLPILQRELVESRAIGKVTSVQIRFACPPRLLDYNSTALPWRVQRDIAGGGYFYDLAPHQIDLLQEIFGPIVRANGFSTNRAGLYETEDTVSAAFQFADGLTGSGSWCFVGHESARTDRIELMGEGGRTAFLGLHLRTHCPLRRRRAAGVSARESRARTAPPHPRRRGAPAAERHLHRGQHQRHERQLGDGPHPGEDIEKLKR